MSHAQDATRTTSWQIRISTAEPIEEVLGPIPLEYTYVADKPTGPQVARFLELRAAGLKRWSLFQQIVTMAAKQCRQVDVFERDAILDHAGWKADGSSWTTTIKPGPLGPVTVMLIGKAAWQETKPGPLAHLSDDFDGEIDPAKWTVDVGSWSNHWSWAIDHTTVRDGSLRIKTSHDPHDRDGKAVPYRSGILKSLAPQRYGYFEARLKAAPRFPGVCPAFWLYNNPSKHSTEIDIVELTNEVKPVNTLWCSTWVFILPGELAKNPRPSKHRVEADFDPRDDFHVYGCDWTKEAIVWYVDGKEVARQANVNHHQPLYVTLSMGIRNPLTIAPAADGFPTEFQVDYVRVWPQKP